MSLFSKSNNFYTIIKQNPDYSLFLSPFLIKKRLFSFEDFQCIFTLTDCFLSSIYHSVSLTQQLLFKNTSNKSPLEVPYLTHNHIMDSKDKNKRTTYKRITQDIRLQLIQRVVKNKQNIKQVVNEMGVNISTAKAILKVYQEEGRVGKKKKRDKVINVIQTYSFYTIDGNNIQKLSDTIIEEEKKAIQTSDSKDVEKELKEKSRERAQHLLKQAVDKYNTAEEAVEMQRNLTQLNELQNQIFYQYCNQPGYPYNSLGGYPFK